MVEGGGSNPAGFDNKAGPSGTNSVPEDEMQSDTPASKTARLKVYPENPSVSGPWVVFFRPKTKPLNVIQITKDLARWPSVTSISKVRPNKLRVVVANSKAANEIVASKFFNLEYRVFVPSRNVEIEGVITEMSLTPEYIISNGVGKFKSLDLTSVKILDCRQLATATSENGKKIYSPSASFRVTFEGTALPHYVLIGGVLRLPVRLFVPRPMTCNNCHKIGHTTSHCSNKPHCSRCGEKHEVGACQVEEQKCIYCGGTPHEISQCGAFKSRWDKQKRSLKERSNRSYAAILKSASPTSQPASNNVFSPLPVDEVESDSADEGRPFVMIESSRKRIRASSSPKIARKIPPVSPSFSFGKKANPAEKENLVPPGFRGNTSPLIDPAVASTSKLPSSNGFSAAPTIQLGALKFSDIVNGIFSFFNVSDSMRSVVNAILPIVKTLVQQLMQTWPLLSAFISLDG